MEIIIMGEILMKKSIKTPTIVILVFIVILTSIFYKSIGVKNI